MKDFDTIYMLQAVQISLFSKAPDKKVGCVLTKDNRPITNGYNGTAPGESNDMVDEEGVTYSDVIHAEDNAIRFCINNDINTEGSTCYVTLSPCLTCAGILYGYGIKRVVYLHQWKNTEGIEYLRDMGVEVEQIGSCTCLKQKK